MLFCFLSIDKGNFLFLFSMRLSLSKKMFYVGDHFCKSNLRQVLGNGYVCLYILWTFISNNTFNINGFRLLLVISLLQGMIPSYYNTKLFSGRTQYKNQNRGCWYHTL